MARNEKNNITDKNSTQENPIPISVAIENTRNQLSEIVNNCINNVGIPPSILELILKDIYMQAREISMKIYQTEKIEYEKTLKESNPEQSD